MIYLLMLLYLIYLVYRYDIIGYKRGKSNNYKVLCCLFICVAGLSYHVGGDSIGYEITFQKYQGMSFNQLYDGNMFANSQEPLWILINLLFSRVFGDFQFLKFAIALFFNLTVFWFVKKYSPRPFFSILVYAVLLFFHLNFQVLRESISIALFLIAFDSICSDNKSYIRYYLICVIAAFVHRFSFFTLLIPLIPFIKLDKYYVAILALMIFIAPILNNLIFSSGLFLFNDSISGTLQYYMDSEDYQIQSLSIFGILETIIKTIPFLLFVYCADASLFKTIGIVYVLLFVFNAVSIGILFRVNDFLLFPFVVTSGIALKNIQTQSISLMSIKLSKGLFNVITVVFLCSTLVSHTSAKNFYEYYPYSSVFTKNIVREREDLIYYFR